MKNIVECIMDNLQVSQMVGLDTLTQVKLKGGKNNPLQGRVTKANEGIVGMISTNMPALYQNMVNRRLAKQHDVDAKWMIAEPYFESEKPKWGTIIEGSPFLEHKGSYYLRMIFIRNGRVTDFVDGYPTGRHLIEGYPPITEEADQKGLFDKVVFRTFKVESIQAVRINKKSFIGPFTY